MYGIYESKQAIAKNDLCYLVEGYTDVIQFHQANIKNVVSSSGTALSIEQIRMIGRLTSNIVVLFDGDEAGLRASLRGNSFFGSNWAHSIYTQLFLENILSENNASDPIKKAETTKEIIQSISKIPDLVKQEIYIQSCSQIMNVSEETLFSSLEQLKQKYRDRIVFKVIGDPDYVNEELNIKGVSWDAQKEVELFNSFDIGQ